MLCNVRTYCTILVIDYCINKDMEMQHETIQTAQKSVRALFSIATKARIFPNCPMAPFVLFETMS